ncbi:MAG: SsrA-binding protein SmpB [Deltaproteobacteria bacterium]|nr:SsrA-binding protein SmpB [Deltaproteobacteria bacterium]
MAKAATESEGILIVSNNKKAFHDYEILERLEAGIVLKGSEVKSIREGNINLKDTYIKIFHSEVYLVGCHISPYSHSRQDAHETVCDRKLLLHKREIEKFSAKTKQKGLTLVPLKVYFKKGRCKVEIGVGKGKKLYDKRQDLKAKEANRDIERAFKKR